MRIPASFGVVAIVGSVAVSCGSGGGAATAGPAPAPRFDDVAVEAGIDQAYTGGFDHFVGGGVAVLDCDRDGWPDLYLAGGESPAALHRNETEVGGPLRFDAVPSPVTDLDGVVGAYPIDLDGDAATDLVVLRNGPDAILRGLADCRFELWEDELGVEGGDGWTTAFSATWEEGEALPTLAFGDYLDGDHETCADNRLVRPATSTSYDPPVALSPGWCTLSMLFSDWGRTGDRDLRVTNDRHYYRDGSEQLWRIRPGQEPRLYGADEGWQPLQLWGMGIASQDLTGDGRPEVFLTSQGDNKLQTLAGDPDRPEYRDMALRAGVTAQRPYVGGDVLPSTAWHPEFADVNDDGLLDLFVTKGNVEAQPDHAMLDPDDLLLGQPDGIFVEAGTDAGIDTFDRSRGAAVVDLDLDGLPDIVVVNREAPAQVWHNAGPDGDPGLAGHWVAVRLRQPAPNTDAIGAWVEVRPVGADGSASQSAALAEGGTLAVELTIGGGHASGQLGWLHLGLGPHDRVELRVVWPDGEAGDWAEVDAGRFLVIDRDEPAPTRWCPEAGDDCPAVL